MNIEPGQIWERHYANNTSEIGVVLQRAKHSNTQDNGWDIFLIKDTKSNSGKISWWSDRYISKIINTSAMKRLA